MNATPVTIDKESVRMLAIEIGVRPAARKLGLNEDRVCQWSHRGNWFPTLPDVQGKTVSTVSKPGDILASELATHENTTRLTLAKYASNAAAAIHKSVHPTRYTRQAKDIAGVMATVHRQDEGKQSAQFSLNVLNLNMFSDTEGPTLD